jgi:DNA-binding NarL/FixJ family response regulator
MNFIRVLLVDDHDILRQGLKLLLQEQDDIQVVAEARNGYEALAQVAIHTPHVVIMDISMAHMDGLDACRQIVMRNEQRNQEEQEHQHLTQVLILTMHESEEYFLQALRMGAAGYLVKRAAPAELINAVRVLARGEVYLYPGLARALIRAYVSTGLPSVNGTNQDTGLHGPHDKQVALKHALDVLTPRELEVLTLVAEGNTNQDIANKLVLSIKTVQAHRANVMDKLGLQDVTHLVRFAIQHGLISSEL